MKKRLLTFAVFVLASLSTYGQADKTSSPIVPVQVAPPSEIGVVFGLGLNLQGGVSKVACENCFFEDGNKFGYTIGLVYEDYIAESEKTKWGAELLFDNLSIYSSFKETEGFEYLPGKSVPTNYRHHSDISLSQLTLIPYFKWSPAKVFFVKAGPSFGLVLNANLEHRQEILDKTTLLPTGETVSLEFDNGTKEIVLEDTDYPDVNKFQFGLAMATGFNFAFGYDFSFSPYFQYQLPFTELSSFGDALKISSWRIMFEFRIKI